MPRTRTAAAPARTPLTAAVDAVDEHLNAYGHRMSWRPAGGDRSMGVCGRCSGRVIVRITADGPAAMADPHMTAPGDGDGGQDYAECPGRRH